MCWATVMCWDPHTLKSSHQPRPEGSRSPEPRNGESDSKLLGCSRSSIRLLAKVSWVLRACCNYPSHSSLASQRNKNKIHPLVTCNLLQKDQPQSANFSVLHCVIGPCRICVRRVISRNLVADPILPGVKANVSVERSKYPSLPSDFPSPEGGVGGLVGVQLPLLLSKGQVIE